MKKFILRVLNKFKLLKFLNLIYRIELNKDEIIVPIQAGVGFNNLYISELWMIEVLHFLKLKKKEVFIDEK